MFNMNFDFTLASEEKPSRSGDYLTITLRGNDYVKPRFTSLSFSTKHQEFNCTDNDKDTSTAIEVFAWAEIPSKKDFPVIYDADEE